MRLGLCFELVLMARYKNCEYRKFGSELLIKWNNGLRERVKPNVLAASEDQDLLDVIEHLDAGKEDIVLFRFELLDTKLANNFRIEARPRLN